MSNVFMKARAIKWHDPLVLACGVGFLSYLLVPQAVGLVLQMAVISLWGSLPFILFAVLALAVLKAASAEALVAKSFSGPVWRMILLAAIVGSLAPFCSCEVVPFIAALLALGVPLAAVMAFWLASPLMDPAMFVITASGLGMPFALGKTLAAFALGVAGGVTVHLMRGGALFADPLRAQGATKCCGRSVEALPLEWRFWNDPSRRKIFAETSLSNLWFLIKWLGFAYIIQALMVLYVPSHWVESVLGGDGLRAITLGALIGMPAYLNGFAAIPLVETLLMQGMADGAAMSFVLAGGVSCIPAAVAVWALVKPRVFAAYLVIAFAGSILAGLAWQAYSNMIVL